MMLDPRRKKRPMAKSTSMPTSAPLKRLLATLAQREEVLRERVAEGREVLEHPAPAGEPDGDDAELAFARTSAHFDRDLIDRYLIEIVEIEQARARIAEGLFGICIDCGTAIGWARLKAIPVARRCTDCQALWEKQFARDL